MDLEEEEVATNKIIRGINLSRESRGIKGTWWMPRRQESKKDVASCDKPRGAANRLRSVDIRMGGTWYGKTVSHLSEHIGQVG